MGEAVRALLNMKGEITPYTYPFLASFHACCSACPLSPVMLLLRASSCVNAPISGMTPARAITPDVSEPTPFVKPRRLLEILSSVITWLLVAFEAFSQSLATFSPEVVTLQRQHR